MSQRIDIYAAFAGLTFLPAPFAVASNSFNPKFILHDEQIEYRVLRTSRVRYEQIARVDVFLFYKTTNLVLTRHDSVFTFMGNLTSTDKLVGVVKFLQAKRCSLTERAVHFIQTTPISTEKSGWV